MRVFFLAHQFFSTITLATPTPKAAQLVALQYGLDIGELMSECDREYIGTDDVRKAYALQKVINSKRESTSTTSPPAKQMKTVVPLSSVTLEDENVTNEPIAPSTNVEDDYDPALEPNEYTSLQDILSKLELGNVALRLENRPRYFMWGLMNSGDLPGLPRNSADQDRWDAFCPGYKVLDTKKSYVITGMCGIMFVDNNNHKIAVTIDEIGFDAKIAKLEIELYSSVYAKNVRPNKFVPYPQCMASDANPFPDIDLCIVCGEGHDKSKGQMLLCDKSISLHATCNHATHVKCAGLNKIPKGYWFCPECV